MMTKAYSIQKREYLQRRPVKTSRKDVDISLIQSENTIVVYRDGAEAFSLR